MKLEKKTMNKGYEKTEVINIVCNKCGESCKEYLDAKHRYHNFNYGLLSPSFGYPSTQFDGINFEVHLCQSCVSEFLETLKIKPEYSEGLFF